MADKLVDGNLMMNNPWLKKLRHRLVDSLVVLPCEKVNVFRKFVTYVSNSVDYNHLKGRFIENGKDSKWDESVRARLVERFEYIDRNVHHVTSRTDILFLVEAFLSMECDGSIVECGCFAGGSTAKLSIVTKLLGKELFVFDSFEGLPEVEQLSSKDYEAGRGPEWRGKWKTGRYAASLDLVKANVEQYGELSVCTFRKGWFSDTLTEENLPDTISAAFTDVDIASSARECLVAIWPRLSEGGVYFSHDFSFIKVLKAIFDEKLWMGYLKTFPPIVFGAGYGLSDSSPQLGFLVKGRTITAEYINSLTITK